ncbi:uncharacterized protein At1g27050 [Diospyros lotus]|uniref:uncharacterized protein At1g27050 n=1 Tax=Diospyros lotus TaxID=55363 RepID=UPI00224D5D23|nr:uncharacterized protein At1g27050 [Diospyros lotus]
MSRKRDRRDFSRPGPYRLTKRRRPPPPSPPHADLPPTSSSKSPATVVVTGLPPDSSLLDIRSRFQIYGCISRTSIRHTGVAYITFRSKDSAMAAVAASLDPSFGITLHSKPLSVTWATDPVPQWREGVLHKDGSNYSSLSASSSKLVRAEVPLSRHGRGNKLGSAIVNPRNNSSVAGLDVPSKGREIVAYDDIL